MGSVSNLTKFSLILTLLMLWLPYPNPPNPNPPNLYFNLPYPPPGRASLEFDVNDLHNHLPLFYNHLTNLVSEPVDGGPTRVLTWNAKSTFSPDYLTHVRFTDGANSLTVFVRSYDLYIIGFQVDGGTAYLLHHDLPLFPEPVLAVGEFVVMLGGAPLGYLRSDHLLMSEMDDDDLPLRLANRAEICLQLHNQRDIKMLNLGDSYGSLESAGGMRRRDIAINQQGLRNAFRGLVEAAHVPASERDGGEIARSILYFTQLISEALRIRPIRNHIVSYFEGAQILPDGLLMLQHGWGRASYRLDRRHATQHSLVFGLRRYDPRDVVTLADMESLYSIILRGMDDPEEESGTQVNMRARYARSLREFEQRRRQGGGA